MNIISFAIIGLIIFLIYKFIVRKFKFPKVGAMALVTGGVKTGKSTLSVSMTVYSEYKRRLRSYKFSNFFRKLFKMPLLEKPLIYSNIPLAVPYSPLTLDLIMRKKRFRYGSVIYCNEASLMADCMLVSNMDINERLMLFNKLIGHELKGGCIIYDTQCIVDCHFSVKRCLSNYFYIHHLTKWIPFFLVATVRECRYSEDGSVVEVNTADVEDSLKRVLIPKKVWKIFDAYCFSSLTDDLEVDDAILHASSLKVSNIVSFRKFKSIPDKFLNNGGFNNEKKND